MLAYPKPTIQLNEAIILLMIHVFGGSLGGKAFYWRYGYWPGEAPGHEKITFKEWFKKSWKYLLLVIAALITVQLILWVYQNSATTILFFGAPLILFIFLILAVIIMHLPKKENRSGHVNSDEKVASNSWLRSSAHISIPAGLTLLVLFAIIFKNPSDSLLTIFFFFPFFIILFGIFYAIGLVLKKK